MSYAIETGIPVPPRKNNNLPKKKKSEERMAIDSLDVGQSVLFEGVNRKKISSIYSSAAFANKPKRYVTRAVDGGFRVWRVA